MLVVHIGHTILRQPELVDAAFEGAFLYTFDRIKNGVVNALHHGGKDVARRFIELVGIHANAKFIQRSCRFEHTEAGRAGGVINDVHALLVLAQGQFFATSRIAERFRRDARILSDHFTVRTHLLHAGTVSGFEFVN